MPSGIGIDMLSGYPVHQLMLGQGKYSLPMLIYYLLPEALFSCTFIDC
jgi:hypothetical protein